MSNFKKQSGFTLVELAIVIVIIGFIVGGVSAGASLIKQAQLRSVISDFASYQTTSNNFLGRYNAVPGDFANGSSYWSACASTNSWCDGDGDGLIEFVNTLVTPTSETRMAWRHMYLAGMLNAGITQPAAAAESIVLTTRAPVSKVTGAGYIMAGYNGNGELFLGTTSAWNGTGKNSVYIGVAASAAGDSTGVLSNGALAPDDAFSLDQKMDDGAISAATFTGANTGVIRTVNAANSAAIGASTNTCIGATAVANPALYRLAVPEALANSGCLLGFQLN